MLRKHGLPSALALDQDLVAITLAARTWPYSGVTNTRFNRVWRNAELYRRAARENPRLLPLVDAAIEGEMLEPGEDPVAGLRRIFLVNGLKPATWRYVARHGARLFKCAWLARTRAPLRVAVDMMRTFEGAGLPPPPRGALARLLACYDGPPEVLGGILRFAHKVQGTPAHVPFLAEARLVLHWVRSELPELDKLQRRAGWPWLINRAQAWQKRREAALAAPRWRSALGEWSDGPYRAVPLDTVESMLDEAAAMRNCLAECIEHCQVGEERYFSVRALETGRRLAVVQLVFDRNAKFWRPGQVKGTCNKDVSATILAVAARLAAQYDEADGGPRQVAEPEWLAQLEEAVTAMTAGSPSEPAPGAP